jgi:hypothetical protein
LTLLISTAELRLFWNDNGLSSRTSRGTEGRMPILTWS